MVKGKIVLIPFPFDDFTETKIRPVLCLTEPIGPNNHIVIAFITSKVITNSLETDLIIKSDNPNFKTTGLHVSSTVQLHRLMTVSSSVIRRELGTLSSEILNKAIKKVNSLF